MHIYIYTLTCTKTDTCTQHAIIPVSRHSHQDTVTIEESRLVQEGDIHFFTCNGGHVRHHVLWYREVNGSMTRGNQTGFEESGKYLRLGVYSSIWRCLDVSSLPTNQQPKQPHTLSVKIYCCYTIMISFLFLLWFTGHGISLCQAPSLASPLPEAGGVLPCSYKRWAPSSKLGPPRSPHTIGIVIRNQLVTSLWGAHLVFFSQR